MTDITYEDRVQELVADLDEEQAVESPDEVTLSSGVVVKRKDVPILRFQAVAEKFQYPEVPLVFNKEKGRKERWAGSEEYQKAIQEVDARRVMAVIDVQIASGIEVVSIPAGVPKIEDDEWIEELELSHIEVKRDSVVARRFAWIKHVACKDPKDLATLAQFVNKQVGTAEANVAAALQENFPDN